MTIRSLDSAAQAPAAAEAPVRATRRLDALWVVIFFGLLAILAGAAFPPMLRRSDYAFGLVLPSSLDLAWAGYGGVLLALGVYWLNALRVTETAGLLRSFGKVLIGGAIGSALALMLLPGNSLHRMVELGPWMFLSSIVVFLTLALVKEGRLWPEELMKSVAGESGQPVRDVLRDYVTLLKPGLNSLVLVTTFVGFAMASVGAPDWLRGLRLLLGTAMVAGGASTLNQVMERANDALMRRTAVRPLPAGRMRADHALAFGCVMSLAGLLLIGLTVDVPTAALAAMTLATYLYLYTPMKRINTLSTLAGAISGALPPLIGWVGAGRGANGGGIILFMILFFWQVPHFLAISWVYREQYGNAGYPMFSVLDPRGRATAFQSLLYSIGLLLASLAVAQPGLSGWYYGATALLLGGWMIVMAVRFGSQPTAGRARAFFFSTLAYLPLLLAMMLFNRA